MANTGVLYLVHPVPERTRYRASAGCFGGAGGTCPEHSLTSPDYHACRPPGLSPGVPSERTGAHHVPAPRDGGGCAPSRHRARMRGSAGSRSPLLRLGVHKHPPRRPLLNTSCYDLTRPLRTSRGHHTWGRSEGLHVTDVGCGNHRVWKCRLILRASCCFSSPFCSQTCLRILNGTQIPVLRPFRIRGGGNSG